MLGLRTAIKVGDEQFILVLQCSHEVLLERCEVIGRHADIDLAPPDAVFGLRVAHDELVIRTPARVGTCLHNKRTVAGKFALSFDK